MGWEVKTLGDLCDLYQPKTITKKDMTPQGAYPVFGANGIIGRYHTYNHEQPQLLIGCRGACGTVNISQPRSWITGNSMVVRPKCGRVSLEFLSYFFKREGILEGTITGAAQPQITRASLAPTVVPIPPLEEQQHIVAILDEAFEGLDRIRTNTSDNFQEAATLFEAGLSQLFAQAVGKATTVGLGAVCKFENGDRGINYPGRKAFVSEGIPFINAGHLHDGAINWASMNFIPEEHFHRLSNGKTKQEDVLFCLRGSLGKFGKVDIAGMAAIASSLVIIRCTDRILPDFLCAYLSSAACALEIKKYAGGAAQPNLSAKSLSQFILPLPSLNEQRTLVERFLQFKACRISLDRHYSHKQNDLETLRQSLLQSAFAGELT